jgi:hypothetical protein
MDRPCNLMRPTGIPMKRTSSNSSSESTCTRQSEPAETLGTKRTRSRSLAANEETSPDFLQLTLPLNNQSSKTSSSNRSMIAWRQQLHRDQPGALIPHDKDHANDPWVLSRSFTASQPYRNLPITRRMSPEEEERIQQATWWRSPCLKPEPDNPWWTQEPSRQSLFDNTTAPFPQRDDTRWSTR